MRRSNQKTRHQGHTSRRAPAFSRRISSPAREPRESTSDTAKDINVVRGDDRPQAVRHLHG